MSRSQRVREIAFTGLSLASLVLVIWLVQRLTWPADPDPRPLVALEPRLASPGSDVETGPLEDGGLSIAREFTPPIHDPSSLGELREAIRIRGPLGLAVLKAEYEAVRLGVRPTREQVAGSAGLLTRIGLQHAYSGQFEEASDNFRKALELGRPGDLPARNRDTLNALLGIVALNQQHTSKPPGLDEAITRFTNYLQKRPGDLRVRWLLHVASLRQGAPLQQVPEAHRLHLESSAEVPGIGEFKDTADEAGLNARGPSMAGGCCFDDFNGDGRPDLLITSLDAESGATLFLNRGDGGFVDRSVGSDLEDQICALNLAHADYDNDGDLDVVLLRGGGESPLRMSLLRNKGDGTFEDVTLASGLGEPIATGAAAWGDYDADGLVDLFVCGEYRPDVLDPRTGQADRRNLCRLYHNQGDGSFRDAAEVAGVVNKRCARGAAWGDFDNDGRLDLLVANADGPARLYRNSGDGTFRDLAITLGVDGIRSSRACWFWDFDQDGRLDLFFTDDRVRPAEFVAAALRQALDDPSQPRLLRNLGAEGFRDLTREAGLDLAIPLLGGSLADIDNDGDLDLYLSSGWPGFSSLVPSRLLRNEGGERFVDVTVSSGTGTLRVAQSVALADWDGDGDLDLFVHGGGFVPGHRWNHSLFRNPGHGRHWLKVRLIGTRTNRSALGASIRVDLISANGRPRSIFRTVGTDSSSGGNSLVQTIGLGDSSHVKRLVVNWPVSRTSQAFQDIDPDQELTITEGKDAYEAVPRSSFVERPVSRSGR
jgi:hypothetical protein